MGLPSRQFVHSSSYAALLDAAAGFLGSLRDFPEILIVAQSRGAADDFVRKHCPNRLGLHRLTLTALAVDLAGAPLARTGLSALSSLSAEAMVARIVHQLKATSIPYFRQVADTPGLARAVAASLAELRLQNVRPADVSSTGPPGQDLARLAERFDEELAAARVADFSILLRHAVVAAREGKHRLLGIPVLLLDIDLESALRRQFLEAVLVHAPAVFAGCLSGDTENLGALENLLGGATAIKRQGRPLDRIRENLFLPGSPDGTPLDDSLDFFSAAGESLECVEIARRIRKLAADGASFDSMAILLRSPERYQSLVEEALRRAGIPAYFSRGVARPDPAGRAFLSLLACAAEGCTATRFAEYLSLGQAPALDHRPRPESRTLPLPEDEVLGRLYERSLPPAEAQPEPDPPEDEDAAVISGTLQSPAAWEKLLVDAAVIGGRERWARRLKGLEAELRVRLNELSRDEEGPRRYLRREITRLKNLERFALPLIDLLGELPGQATWGEWLERLNTLADAALRRPESVLSILTELQAMAGIGPVGLDEVTGVLSDRLRFLRREPPLRRYGQVFIGGIDEIRGRAFDTVFLPGLCEGLFPSRAREDPILLDGARRKLPGATLRTQDNRVAAERRRLRIACAAAGCRLVFSYPRMDVVESRPRVPSFYALEIVRAARGHLPGLREFEEKARNGAPTRLDRPGPADPKEAIDDAEYDFAALAFATGETAKAIGHYLIRANPHLVRSLRAYARRSRAAWSYADGLIDPDGAALMVLETQRLSARSYSPSSLQHFAACPYRFLLHAIHHLRPREVKVALEQMDPLTRGALFHETQFRLFRELQDRRLLPIRPLNVAWVLQIADTVLDQVAAEQTEKLAPALPRVWRSEIEDLRGDLRGWIQRVAEADDAWLPVHFEFSFGMKEDESHDPESTGQEAVLDHGVRLKGAIDLIERHPTRGCLRITDHKTGKRPQPEPTYVGGGAYLQPLAYALAAEKLFGASVEMSRLWYCTQRGEYYPIPFEVTPRSRQWFHHSIGIIDREIERGFLPAAPHRDACSMCDYLPVCGPNEELRIRRKQKDALDTLQMLRNVP